MALVPCRECGKEVSDQAESCPYCGIKNPSQKRYKVKMIITAVIILLVIGASAWAYHRVSQFFSPPITDSDSTHVVPKIQKNVPIKEQILQKDTKEKVNELIDSGMHVAKISDETGLSKKEIKKIKKERKQKEKEAEEAAAARKH